MIVNVTPPELHSMCGFLGDLLQSYREGDHMDLDGCDVQDLLVKHGLMYETKATEADCEEEWCMDWGCEPGDTLYKYTAIMIRLMDMARGRAATERKAHHAS